MSGSKRPAIPLGIKRANAFRKRRLEHAKFREAREEIIRHFKRAYDLESKPNNVAKPEALLLLGESNSGKTFLLKQCSADIRRLTKQDDAVIILTFARNPTIDDLVRQFFEVLVGGAAPPDERWSEQQKIDAIRAGIRNSGVRMIFLDEAQHLTKQQVGSIRASDFLKRLIDVCQVPFVFSGMLELKILEKNPQLKSRLRPPISLRKYDWSDAKERAEFVAIVEQLVRRTRLPTKLKFSDPKLVARLFFASKGLVGNLIAFFAAVIEHALKDPAKPRSITNALLTEVFNRIQRGLEMVNEEAGPFDKPGQATRSENPFNVNRKRFVMIWHAHHPLQNSDAPA